MKNILYLFMVFSCSSCSLFKNVSKNSSRATLSLDSSSFRVKKDSAQLQVKKDTASGSNQTVSESHQTVTDIDTTVTIPGHSMQILSDVPTDSTRYQYDDGTVETTISKKNGKLAIDTRVKERKVPVRGKKTTTDSHVESRSNYQRGSQIITQRTGSSDSAGTAVHKKEKTKTVNKESKASVKGIITGVLIILLVVFLGWRLIVFWAGGAFLPLSLFKKHT